MSGRVMNLLYHCSLPSTAPSAARWLRDAGWEEDKPWETPGERVCVREAPGRSLCCGSNSV